MNGTETDVDCGGICNGCENGDACLVPADCVGGACEDNICETAPNCLDGMLNQDETDIDCGGTICGGCGGGDDCVLDRDCANGTCESDVCVV